MTEPTPKEQLIIKLERCIEMLKKHNQTERIDLNYYNHTSQELVDSITETLTD